MALTELLASLANLGVYVVLTTHSPYIVDHLTNLMEAARLSPDKRTGLRSQFILRREEAMIPSEKVAIYLFERRNGRVEARDILDREHGDIDWETFASVSDQTSNLYSHILESRENVRPDV